MCLNLPFTKLELELNKLNKLGTGIWTGHADNVVLLQVRSQFISFLKRFCLLSNSLLRGADTRASKWPSVLMSAAQLPICVDVCCTTLLPMTPAAAASLAAAQNESSGSLAAAQLEKLPAPSTPSTSQVLPLPLPLPPPDLACLPHGSKPNFATFMKEGSNSGPKRSLAAKFFILLITSSAAASSKESILM